ncbi:MAG: terpene cyclase/mutase family protein, partial [Oscillospiraceae bacterium]|nr:terpene cyclase/mutase family protein [Oscillospiraceae bacterium]
WFSHSALEEAIEKPAEFLAKNPGNWTASALQAAGKPIPKTVINQLKKEVKASSPGDLVTDLIRLIINASATRRINVEALLGWMYGSPNMTAQGLNGPVFALLSRSGGSVYADKRVELKGYVLDRQNPDGGFSLLEGWESDPDMTALVLTALCESEHDSTRLRERTQTVAGRAFDWLSANQNADGSFGAPPSAESSATAIMALKSWGILPDDVRFVKNGRTALDGLMGFYNGEGFMHVLGAETDTIATEQALLALCDGGFGQPFGVAVHSGKSGIQDYAPHFFIAGFTLILLAISGVLVYKKIKRKKSENQT